MRRNPLLVLLVGVALLSAGLLATAGAVAQEHQRDRTIQRDTAQVASAFTSYFERARSLDLLLAQSPALSSSVGPRADQASANVGLAYLEKLYPGAIGEACLIDDQGHEIARVTRGSPAAFADLSTQEGQNPFFAPTLALPPGAVYQAAPYVSPDTRNWVISNSTWVREASGQRRLVHFEVALDSFQPYLKVSSGSLHVAVVDRRTGRIVLQDNTALPAATATARFPQFGNAAALTHVAARPVTVDLDGQRVAASSVVRTTGNANDWVMVEWSTASASSVPPWIGGLVAAIGIGLICLFLLLVRRQQSALSVAARLDHLTGMANRKALEEAMDRAVAAAATPVGDRVAVLMIDLDGFKQINDALGHDKGDLVLMEIGRRLHANTFEYDTAARLGGDEFAVVLRMLREADDVAAVAHRLREALIRPIEVDGVVRFIGASVGAAVYGDHGRSSAELLRAADAAMYQAKRGREGVRVYDAGTMAGSAALGLAAELLIAIEEEALTLAFQPEFALETRQIVGVEALARWHRPGEGEIPPVEFIPLAEHTGLIRPLTHLVLRKALDEARTWHAAGVRIPVSVNLSPRLLTDRSLCADVAGMLDERGLTGEALVLEITETALIGDLGVAMEVLLGLRSLGVRIELDDFGSGYASFKALHELPLDGVKIDRELVSDSGRAGEQLLAATIDIGRRLGLKIVAEGIEDCATLDLVQLLGAHTAQGYHLARPMDARALRALFGLDPHTEQQVTGVHSAS